VPPLGGKKILLRLPPEFVSALENGSLLPAVQKGLAALAGTDSPTTQLKIDAMSDWKVLTAHTLSALSRDESVISHLLAHAHRASILFAEYRSNNPSTMRWAGGRFVVPSFFMELRQHSVLTRSLKQAGVSITQTIVDSFALFLVFYYVAVLGGWQPPISETSQNTGAMQPLWRLSPKKYDLKYPDHMILYLANILPLQQPEGFEELTDPYGTYHDVALAAALYAAIITDTLTIPRDAKNYILTALKDVPADPNLTFEDAFYEIQKALVDNYVFFAKKIAELADLFGHLITIIYDVDPKTEKDQFGPERTFVDVRSRPGTYWVHATFIAPLPSDKIEYVYGTTTRFDMALFNDRSLGDTPVLRVSKVALYHMLSDTLSNKREYLILVRTKVRLNAPKQKSDGKEDSAKIAPGRLEYELLSLVPISPEIVVRRSRSSEGNAQWIRDNILGEPSSTKEVLQSLYLLARAYSPTYAVLYDGMTTLEKRTPKFAQDDLVGKDQYLALVASMLSYLSPTLALSRFDRKYDARIHTLLYGIKGVGKTYLMEQYASNWKFNTLSLFAGVRISEAKLLGGARRVLTGKATKLVFEPGEILKSDGGMILIDELDRLARDSDKRPIADAIANVMASGYAPARHVLSDMPSLDVRVHASILAAANPIGLKTGKYAEEAFLAMFLLNDSLREHYRKIAPKVVDTIEKKLFEVPSGETSQTTLERLRLKGELEYLANDTPYTFIQQDFYNDAVLHKYIDRVSFTIPMFTMVTTPPKEFMDSGRTVSGNIRVYDSIVEDGMLEIPLDALVDFTIETQTISPFVEGDDHTNLDALHAASAKISEAWRIATADEYAAKIEASGTSRETVRVFMKALAARESRTAYKLAHTILKIFGEDTLHRKYINAILKLLHMRDSLLYMHPSGHRLIPKNLPTALKEALETVLRLGKQQVGGRTIYFVSEDNVKAAYAEIINTYTIRAPDDTTVALDVFDDLLQNLVRRLEERNVFIQKQDASGEILPALPDGLTPSNFLDKLNFKINQMGYVHVIYDGMDYGSIGRVKG